LRFASQHQDAAIAFLPTAPSLYQITGRVPPVPSVLLIQGVTGPDQLARVESTMVNRPVEWVVYYKIDFSKDLPAIGAVQNLPFQFDEFLANTYQRADQDGLVLYQLKH
jgi:hypothetical protein